MKRKQFLACMMIMAMAATVAMPTITAKAEGLTQATSIEEVNYGTLTESDKEILKGMFDFNYYKEQNPELVEVLGDDYDKLFKHFCLCGIFEGRTCNANFDPSAYASAYTDLREKFGLDIMKYYEHYFNVGSKEERPLTTIAACAEAGITVEGLVGENVKISPAVYKLALRLGTTNFQAVQNLVNGAAYASHHSSGGGSDSYAVLDIEDHQVIIVPEGGDDEAYANASNLTKIGTFAFEQNGNFNTFYYIYIVEGTTGYAAYNSRSYGSNPFDGYNPVYSSEHYVSKATITSDDIVAQVEIMGSRAISDEEWDELESSEASYNYTGTGYYKDVSVISVEVEDLNKNVFSTTVNDGTVVVDGSSNEIETESTATEYCDYSYELAGYYENADGTEIHRFASEEERNQWIDEKYDTQNYGTVAEGQTFYAYDLKGDGSTTYDVGINITENADGTATVTVGMSNDANEFGYLETFTVGDDSSEEGQE